MLERLLDTIVPGRAKKKRMEEARIRDEDRRIAASLAAQQRLRNAEAEANRAVQRQRESSRRSSDDDYVSSSRSSGFDTSSSWSSSSCDSSSSSSSCSSSSSSSCGCD